ncbi:nitrous oxide reductase accessory protein NosL [Paragemmobacter straminiformis]|uniref:Nitrous oxide reductase accessory protein NosL n=1 Tax=Paragemmobacter straminiformis TaxID=2045119 RepID=A0A842IA41_9RHOB|nr:nitrous oxide reductase accessory protein NosL [Gemmobacter straminiformis]MBC2836505.1 nitrous oxide reductase accessory protein NosL [Gemmobacter straminiformis]
MKKLLLLALLLGACREEAAQAVDPVALTADAIDHYCQMNVTEHSGPKGQVHLEGLPQAPLFFAQIRDTIAYARMPEQTHRILAIWVNDMGATGATWDDPGAENWIDAQTAFYVIGSSRMGGMGAPELVPFSDPAKAAAFAATNGGKVVTLADVPDSAVIAPDEPEATLAEDEDYQTRLKALSHHHTGG